MPSLWTSPPSCRGISLRKTNGTDPYGSVPFLYVGGLPSHIVHKLFHLVSVVQGIDH